MQKEPLELNFTITNNSLSTQLCELFGANFTVLPPKSVLAYMVSALLPTQMDFNPVTNTIYAVNPTANSVSVFDCATNTTGVQILTPISPRAIAYNSLSNQMYVSCFSSKDVQVIDCATNTVVNVISLGAAAPQGIAYNIIDNTMYVCGFNTNDVIVIDCYTDIVTATLSVGTGPFSVTYNQQMNRVYVGNATSKDISVVDCDTNTVTGLITTITDAPSIMAHNTLNNTLYVSISAKDELTIVDCLTNTTISSIALGTSTTPRGISYDRANNNMYVANVGSGNCMIISCASNTILSTITTGSSTRGAKFNPINNNVYVSNIAGLSTGISVIGNSIDIVPAYNVPYAQVLRDSATHPFTVGQIRMTSTNNSQVIQNMSIVSQNIYGSSKTEPLTMEDTVSEYQYQAGIAKTKKEFDITGNVGVSFNILAQTVVVCTVSIKKIIRMPTRFDSSIVRNYPIQAESTPIEPILIIQK